MPDLACAWQDDLVLTPDGDLMLVDGIDLDNQRIERRLLTAVQGYLWHEGYGGGLPQRIGRTALDRGIRAVVLQQLYAEASVARVPLPVVTVTLTADTSGLCPIVISYTNAITGKAEEIALEVPTSR